MNKTIVLKYFLMSYLFIKVNSYVNQKMAAKKNLKATYILFINK